MTILVNAIPNPFRPFESEKEFYEFEEGQSLDHYLSHIDLASESINFVVCCNEDLIEEDFSDVIIKNNTIISICAVVEAPAIAAYGAGALFAAGTVAYAVTYAVVYLAVSFAISYGLSALASALAPDPTAPSSTGSDTSVAQVYGWGDLYQTTGEGTNIPILFGINKIAGQVLTNFVTVDGDKETLNTLLGICDHQVDSITDIKINNQPFSYFKDVEIIADRVGTNNDAVIPGFDEVVTQVDIGSQLAQGSPVVQQTGGTSVEKLVIQISAPNGLYYGNDEGGLDARSAVVDVSYRLVGAGSWIVHGTTTMTNATNKTQRTTVIIDDLSAGQYEVQLERTNAVESSSRGNNDVYFSFLQEIVKQALIYPGLAKYAIKVLATDQLSGGAPNYTCIATRSTVQVFDESLPTPAWVAKRATNPAWMAYSLLTEYAGIDKSRIIWSDFKIWADYCDEIVDGDYRFAPSVTLYNGNFESEVQKIARLGRAAIIRRGTRYGTFVDRYEGVDPQATAIFSMGNIIENSFSLQYLSKKDRSNAVDVEYTDVDREYSRQVIAVYSEDYLEDTPTKQRASVNIQASIKQKEAVREGVFRINNNKYLDEAITFDAFTDSFACTVGDLFYFKHITPDYDNGAGGRILGAGNSDGNGKPYVILDQAIEFDVPYSILIRLEDGTFVEKIIEPIARPIYEGNWVDYTASWGSRYENVWDENLGAVTIINVTTTFTTLPEKYDVYILGPTSSYKEMYRLTSVDRTDDFVRSLSAIRYVPEIYTDNDSYIIEEPAWITRKQTAIQVILNEFLSYAKDGSYRSNINVSWVREYSQESASWTVWLENTTAGTAPVNLGQVDENSLAITEGLVIGQSYKIYVVALGDGATDTGNNTSAITLQGKLAPPSDVVTFAGTWDSIKRQVHFTWSAIDDIDLSNYIIKSGGSWATGTIVAEPTTNFGSIFIEEGVSAVVTYRIKAIDDSGIESTTEDVIGVAIDTSDCPLTIPGALALASASEITSDGTNVVSLTATWNADSEVSDDFHHYDLQLEDMTTGKISAFSTPDREFRWELIPNKSYGVTLRAVDVSGNHTPWVTQVLLTTAKDTTPPATPTWPSTGFAIAGFKVVGLDWDDNTEPDLSHYILERSINATFASDITILGTIDASFHSDSNGLLVSTAYYYRLKAVDSSGNESGYSSIVTATTLQVGTTDIAAGSIIADKINVTEANVVDLSTWTVTAGIMKSTLWDTLTTGVYANLNAGTFRFSNAGVDALTWDGVNLAIKGNAIVDGTITADKYAELRNTYVYTGEDSLDSTHSFDLDVKVVSEMTAVDSIKVSFKIKNYRAYSDAALSGGGSTSGASSSTTTAGGGGSTTSSSTNSFATTGGICAWTIGALTSNPTNLTCKTGAMNSTFICTSCVSGTAIHGHKVCPHCHCIGNHVHCLCSSQFQHCHCTGDHTHSTTLPNHCHGIEHTHSTPDHTHTVGHNIYEEINSPSIVLKVYSGVAWTTVGTYTTDQTDLDITSLITTSGWKIIRFESTTRTRIFCSVDLKLDITA